jgi:hypothetical protein
MTCPICKGTGIVWVTTEFFADGNWFPDEIETNCECNPEPTDDDAPHWADDEPRGTAEEDFRPFIAARYEGC